MREDYRSPNGTGCAIAATVVITIVAIAIIYLFT